MNDDDIFIIYFMMLLAHYHFYLKKTKRVRRFKVRPLNRAREEKGMFNNLLKTMITEDHEMFFKYTRMTPQLFRNLLRLVGPKLQKDNTKNPISPPHRLIITLHYLAEGCSMQERAYGHYLGLTTVSVIIKETTKVLWEVLAPVFVKKPEPQNWVKIADGFFHRWNLPNCIGSVDGKHINIEAPKNSGSTFFNYMKNHSIVLMAACDAYYRFILVDVGAAGSNHDSVVFKESAFGCSVLNETMDLPSNKCLPKSNISLPHFFAADAAFPLHKNIMRPYPGTKLSRERLIFNYRLSRARRTIENSFGILAQRWRILKRPIIAIISTVEQMVLATVALHNYLQQSETDLPLSERRYCPTGFADTELSDGTVVQGQWRSESGKLRSVGRIGANNAGKTVKERRENLCQYLNSHVGAVSWQLDHILKGSIPINSSSN